MRVCINLMLFLMLMQSAYAQVVLHKSESLPDRYIVKFSGQQDMSAQLRTQKSGAIKELRLQQKLSLEQFEVDLQNSDLKIIRNLWIKHSVAISISPRYLPKIQALSYVDEVRTDVQYKVEQLGVVTLPISGELVQDNLERIDVDTAWSAEYRGQGVVVAILDSGVDIQHEDLAGSWRGGSNSWFDPYQEQPDPIDLSGHGTAVGSIVLGGNAAGSHVGVAPNAQWIAARIFNDQGSSSESAISEVLQWVVDPDGDADTDDFPDIVQNSWGLDATEGKCINPFTTELAVIDALGIDQVFAVGNSGSTGPSSYLTPTFDSHVISVGALENTDFLLFSSSRGPDKCGNSIIPSVVAPGELIRTADLTFGGFDTDNVTVNSGTSFSAPHVSGALALIRSKFKTLDHMLYRSALFDSATNLGDPNDYGRGLIQASKAMTLLQNQSAQLRTKEVSFSQARYVFSETELNAKVSVFRLGDISDTASVTIQSADGTAKSTTDYTFFSITLDFLAGESVKTVDLQLTNDIEAEKEETFQLLLSQNTNTNLGDKTTLNITITDDETAEAEEEDESGGGSNGLIELLFFSLLALRRWAW